MSGVFAFSAAGGAPAFHKHYGTYEDEGIQPSSASLGPPLPPLASKQNPIEIIDLTADNPREIIDFERI